MPRKIPEIPITERRTLTVTETAAVLGICRCGVYKLFADGKLQSALIAGRRLVPREAIDAMIEAAQATSA